MKASILIKICLSVLILPWISILASTPPIFSAHIKVGDYSKKAQKIAVSKGFKNVLIKATGNSNVINLHEIQDEIKNSENYVQSYNYKIIKSNSDKKELYLNVNFSSKEIKQLLENINQPTWDNKRPSVLIWLAVNNYKGNSFLIHDSNSIAKILKNDFENRGLNTLFPIGDLTDINNVSLSDLYNSKIPCDRQKLMALPGIGRKSANVILNVVYDMPTIGVDTHIFRVCNRAKIATGKTPLKVEEKLLSIVPKDLAKYVHHLLVLYGRYVCKAKNFTCSKCVISDLCEFKNKNN